jgi:hypothetical protein
MIAEDRIVPAFDVQVRIVAGTHEGVDDLCPVRFAETGEPVFGHPRMADAVGGEQRAIDEGILGVNVKDPPPELAQVLDGVDELADQVAGIPFEAQILAGRRVEEALPHGRLAEQVVVHDRQVIGPLRTMLEGDAHSLIGRQPGQRFPEGQQLREVVLGGLVNQVAPALVEPGLDDSAGETGHRLHADVRRDFDGPAKHGAGELRLVRIQRVLVIGADGREAQVSSLGLGRDLFDARFPVGVARPGRALRKAHPFQGTEAQPFRPVQLRHLAPCKHSDSHG